jgi:hypothetical protein
MHKDSWNGQEVVFAATKNACLVMGYGACKQLGYSRIGQSTNLNKG